MTELSKRYKQLLLGTAALACVAYPVMTSAAVAEDGSGLEEIMVTAQKISQNLQRTPVSVTVVSAKTIEQTSLTNIKDIDRLAPNLQYSAGPSGSSSAANFFIRGIGQIDFAATSDPGVAVYIDDVYIPRTVGAGLDTSGVEQIQVLKGPQGTLFGKNTIGGAVVITTEKPDDKLHGLAEGTIGNLHRMDGKFMVNVPLTDTLFMRMSGVTRNNDGYSRRLIDGVKLGDDHDVGGRLQFRWMPSSNFEAQLSIDGTQRRAHIAAESAVKVIPSFASDTFKLRTGLDVMDYPAVANGWEVSTTGVRPTDNMNVFGASLHLDWNLGSTHLKSITAYRRLTEDTAADFDGTALKYNDQLVGEHQKQFSQEFQLTHKTDSFNGILGVYYMHESNPETVVSYYTGFYANVPYGTGVNQTEAVTDNSYSAYGQGTYNFTKALSLTGGLRVTYEKKHVRVSGEQGALPVAWVLEGDKSWSDVSPHVGINYQVTPDLMVYGSLTGGFKSGSYNARPGGNATYLPYDPERVWSDEVGFKSQWLDNKLRLNAAAFLTHYHAIQLLTLSLDQNGFLYFPVNNAGDLNIKGFEVEIQARPVKALNLYANLGHATESWSKIYTPEDDPRILFPIVTNDTRLPSLSHWTLNAGADLTIPLANFGTATLGGSYSYRSSYFFDTGNGSLSEQKSFGLIDGYFIVAPESDSWQIKFWGKNLANKHYMTFAQDALSYDSHAVVWWGRPREFGVTFRVSM